MLIIVIKRGVKISKSVDEISLKLGAEPKPPPSSSPPVEVSPEIFQ